MTTRVGTAIIFGSIIGRCDPLCASLLGGAPPFLRATVQTSYEVSVPRELTGYVGLDSLQMLGADSGPKDVFLALPTKSLLLYFLSVPDPNLWRVGGSRGQQGRAALGPKKKRTTIIGFYSGIAVTQYNREFDLTSQGRHVRWDFWGLLWQINTRERKHCLIFSFKTQEGNCLLKS